MNTGIDILIPKNEASIEEQKELKKLLSDICEEE